MGKALTLLFQKKIPRISVKMLAMLAMLVMSTTLATRPKALMVNTNHQRAANDVVSTEVILLGKGPSMSRSFQDGSFAIQGFATTILIPPDELNQHPHPPPVNTVHYDRHRTHVLVFPPLSSEIAPLVSTTFCLPTAPHGRITRPHSVERQRQLAGRHDTLSLADWHGTREKGESDDNRPPVLWGFLGLASS